MKSLILENDKYKMNWVKGNTEWGTVRVPDELSVSRQSRREGDVVYETYEFTNKSDKAVSVSLLDWGIAVPFNDDYVSGADECMIRRCHTHIWCGENISWICALRMGGNHGTDDSNVGLVLTEGSISGYSVERDVESRSNDRGDFILHPTPAMLETGESVRISWVVFPHSGKKDFMKKAAGYCRNFIEVISDRYLYFHGEEISFDLKLNHKPENLEIRAEYSDGREELTECSMKGELYHCSFRPVAVGQIKVKIEADGTATHMTVLVQPEFDELLSARVNFIAEHQQLVKNGSPLDGAYLIYDNEENHMVYKKNYDWNSGRERVGMGVLAARYLQSHSSASVESSLGKFTAFVMRELFDCETGMVYNDYGRDNKWNRMYNYPWISVFFCELYRLYKDRIHAVYAYKAMKSFYDQGGAHFYAIEIPVRMLSEVLRSAGMEKEYDEMLADFTSQADFILERGTSYPKHEVNFEQSIVAPAANLLLETYEITGDEKYLTGAEKQLEILSLFNGMQPDYHLYEVAIRHWDGYWFGKNKTLGDTFPHYWSSLTATAYEKYADITGDKSCRDRAEAAFRAVLSMFFPDGRATCAFVYPDSVNGVKTHCADPFANDQDWGMYFYLRHKDTMA